MRCSFDVLLLLFNALVASPSLSSTTRGCVVLDSSAEREAKEEEEPVSVVMLRRWLIDRCAALKEYSDVTLHECSLVQSTQVSNRSNSHCLSTERWSDDPTQSSQLNTRSSRSFQQLLHLLASWSMSNPPKSTIEHAIKAWVDDHRELILLSIVLPIGTLYGWYMQFQLWWTAPDASKHSERVKRIQAAVKSAIASKQQQSLRTNRNSSSSLNTRSSDKSLSRQVVMDDLRAILEVDTKQMRVRIEPFVTTAALATHLDKKYGLQVANTIEMNAATWGGLVLATGMTTHAHHEGLIHDVVTAFEVVTASGELVRATADNEHADLFRALPWSHGTLGLLVGMEMRLVKSPKYVKLQYRVFKDQDIQGAYLDRYRKQLTAGDEASPYYLEGQIFSARDAVLIEGHAATQQDILQFPVNDIAWYYKPFFYRHVESFLQTNQDGYTELIPNLSYLLRHERSMCMTMGSIMPTANDWRFRWLFGWMMPPNMNLLKNSRPPEERQRSMRTQVYQDMAVPETKMKDFLQYLEQEFSVYPLLMYPCKVIDRGGFVRLPRNHGKPYQGIPETGYYLNLGIYGIPKPIRSGNTKYPTVTKVREVEQYVRDNGGFLHTYVDVFSTKEEFEQMFDHTLWRQVRKVYDPTGVFPEIYDKIKPELDPLSFLSEEEEWISQATTDKGCSNGSKKQN